MGTDNNLLKKMYSSILIVNVIGIVSGIACVMVDAMVTGRFLGEDAVAAAGLLQPVVLVINLVVTLFGGGLGTLLTRYLGKAQHDKVNQVYSTSMLISIVLTIALNAIVFFCAPVIASVLGRNTGSDEIVRMISDYLRGFSFSLLPQRINILLAGIMVVDNDKRRSMMCMGTTLVMDIIFDLANVIIFHGGMFGMAIATVLSCVAGFLVMMTHFFRKNRVLRFSPKYFNASHIKDIVLCGAPSSLTMGGQALRTACYNAVLLAIAGKSAVAAISVCFSSFSIVFAVALGIFVSTSVISSLLYGEEDRHGLETVTSISIKSTLSIFCVVTLLMLLFPKVVAALFIKTNSADALVQAARFIRLMAVQFIVMVVSFPITGIYQGTRQFKLNYLINIMREAGFPVICVTVLGKLFGLRGVEAAIVLSGVLVLILCCIIPVIYNGTFPKKAADFLILSDDFGASPDELYEASMHDMNDVINSSEEVRNFCINRGIDKKQAVHMALFIEEMAGNTIEHGYAEGEEKNVNLRLILHGDSGVIRMRDDGKPFDPIRWLEKNSGDDPVSGLGIRVVTGLAKNVHYMAAMEMNNLIITL